MPVISFDKSHKSWHWSQDVAKAMGQCHRYLDALHEAAQRALHGLNTRMHAITVMTYDHLLARAEAMLAVLDR